MATPKLEPIVWTDAKLNVTETYIKPGVQLNGLTFMNARWKKCGFTYLSGLT